VFIVIVMIPARFLLVQQNSCLHLVNRCSRTLTGFESQSDHTLAWVRETFSFYWHQHTWGCTFWSTDILVSAFCIQSWQL